jgi:hypothetical protein
MNEEPMPRLCTAFDGPRRLASGPLAEVALAVKAASRGGAAGPLLVFDDATGRVIDLDLRGSDAEIAARLREPEAAVPGASRGPGRPRLGVVAREVTLLPRHWEWLSAQPGGASVVLRRLVDAARAATSGDGERRARQEAAYRVMSAMAGDLPGFEEASRALFTGRRDRLEEETARWPADLRRYVLRLADGPVP